MQSERMTARVQMETRRRLERILMQNEAAVRGELANLRRGVGRVPGDLPALWGMLFDQLPDDMLGQYAQPSRAEWAIYAAVTLYALHQQGKDPQRESMNQQGVSLGRAAAILVWKEGEGARERIARRFHQVALSSDMEGLTYYLRGFVQLLRSGGRCPGLSAAGRRLVSLSVSRAGAVGAAQVGAGFLCAERGRAGSGCRR